MAGQTSWMVNEAHALHEPPRVETSLDRVVWELRRDVEETATQHQGRAERNIDTERTVLVLLVCIAVIGPVLAGILLSVAAGVSLLNLSLSAISLWLLWPVRRVRAPTRVTVEPHRIRIERAGRWRRHTVADLLWEDIDAIRHGGQDIVLVERNGAAHLAPDLGSPEEVRWLCDHLADRLAARPEAGDEAAAADARRTVQAITGAVEP